MFDLKRVIHLTIEIFIKCRTGKKSLISHQNEEDESCYCIGHEHSFMESLSSFKRKIIKGALNKDAELALSRLALALDISESKDLQIIIKNSNNAINLLEIWMKYNTKITPLIVIDQKVFRGVPSILELLNAVLSRNIKHPDSSILVQLN